MYCEEIKYTSHADKMLDERQIRAGDVDRIVKTGEIIREYLTDVPHPSRLLLGFVDERPIHVLVGRDDFDGVCYVVTAYEPDVLKWKPDFKTKIKN